MSMEMLIGTILEDINSILTKSAEISYERPKYRKTNSKLKVWNSDIKDALKESKEAH